MPVAPTVGKKNELRFTFLCPTTENNRHKRLTVCHSRLENDIFFLTQLAGHHHETLQEKKNHLLIIVQNITAKPQRKSTKQDGFLKHQLYVLKS